jgi:uncharacterized protein
MDYRVFVDSSAFRALIDENDDFNQRAEKILADLVKTKCELVTSNYIIDECATLIRMKSGFKKAMLFKKYLTESDPVISLYRVRIKDESDAWKWFENEWSGLSFTDCVSFAMMKRLGIKKVFGFDQHFERAGFVQVGRE